MIGFQFSATYSDNELLRIRVSASNGSFAGTADIYVGIGQIEQIARTFKGFPNSISDTRKVTLGAFGPEFAGGAISMLFYCADGAGHAFVDSTIESDADSTGRTQSVTFSLAVEAAAVDAFVEELGRLGIERAGQANLRGIVRDR